MPKTEKCYWMVYRKNGYVIPTTASYRRRDAVQRFCNGTSLKKFPDYAVGKFRVVPFEEPTHAQD